VYSIDQTFFCNVVVVTGLLIQAMLVGAATQVVQTMDSQQADYSRRLSRIKNYLSYKGVPPALKRRVMFYYKFMWTSMGSLDESDVLPKLPPPLKTQMDIVLTRNFFVSNNVFQACRPDEILRMVQGLVPYLALPDDVLIEEGSIGLGLFFIMRGTVVVVRKLDVSRALALGKETGEIASEEELHRLTEGFFGEETVIHGRAASATVRAVLHSDFFLLPMAVFDKIVEGNAEMRKQVMEYAEGRESKVTKHWGKIKTSVNPLTSGRLKQVNSLRNSLRCSRLMEKSKDRTPQQV